MRPLRALMVILLAPLCACGSSTGSGGAGGGGNGGGTTCPATAPASGAACVTSGEQCTYLDCSGSGVTTATCNGGTFSVSQQACQGVFCGEAGACSPGQLCVTYQGGAQYMQCLGNPCGTGPITCSCVCGGPCISGSGLSWTCNTCPQGRCP